MNNYEIQVLQAKKHFLSYDQQELIRRCHLRHDERYFYFDFLSEPYRLCRNDGNLERFHENAWIDGNSFGEVMTVLDWLCDSRAERYIAGRWINIVTHGHYFHGQLQEGNHAYAAVFDQNPEGFSRGCLRLKGTPVPGADLGFAVELIDGLCVLVQLWHGDEEFKPRLRCLWDENTTRYIRYETTWFAVELLLQRIKENMI